MSVGVNPDLVSPSKSSATPTSKPLPSATVEFVGCKCKSGIGAIALLNSGFKLKLFASWPTAVFHEARSATSNALNKPKTLPVPLAK